VRTERDPEVLVTLTRAHARGLETGAKIWLVPSRGATRIDHPEVVAHRQAV
jgi:hypothetical protein